MTGYAGRESASVCRRNDRGHSPRDAALAVVGKELVRVAIRASVGDVDLAGGDASAEELPPHRLAKVNISLAVGSPAHGSIGAESCGERLQHFRAHLEHVERN